MVSNENESQTNVFRNSINYNQILMGIYFLFLCPLLIISFIALYNREMDIFDVIIIIILSPSFLIVICLREFFLRPKIVIFLQDGINLKFRGRSDQFISWNSMDYIQLYTGNKRWRWSKYRAAELHYKNKSIPIFLEYELGIHLTEQYRFQNGFGIKEYKL